MATMPEILVEVRAIGHCKDCRWWELPEGYAPDDGAWGTCIRAGTIDGSPKDRNTLAEAHDGEQYVGYLLTAPAFGCVQWESKVGE